MILLYKVKTQKSYACWKDLSQGSHECCFKIMPFSMCLCSTFLHAFMMHFHASYCFFVGENDWNFYTDLCQKLHRNACAWVLRALSLHSIWSLWNQKCTVVHQKRICTLSKNALHCAALLWTGTIENIVISIVMHDSNRKYTSVNEGWNKIRALPHPVSSHNWLALYKLRSALLEHIVILCFILLWKPNTC